MPKKEMTSGDHHFRETETAAYHAFREWPVFLLIRKRELEMHLAPVEIERAALPTVREAVAAPVIPAIQKIITPATTAAAPSAPVPPSAPSEIQIPLSSIEWKGGTQARVKGVNPTIVSEYAARMRDGERPPAITVYFDGQTYWPADGFHRAAAAQMNGETEISVEVRTGNKRDALLYGIQRNSAHGLRYSNEDKRHAIRLLLSDVECAAWSDREIAQHCGVDHKTVGAVRKELALSTPATSSTAEQRKVAVLS